MEAKHSERLPSYKCPGCLKYCVTHNWGPPEDIEGGEDKSQASDIIHWVVCTNCGRSTLPMSTEAAALDAFVRSTDCCWYLYAPTVLLSIDKLNELIKAGKELDAKAVGKLDLRGRLG